MTFTPKQRKWIFILFFTLIAALTAYMFRPYFSALFVGGLIAYFLYPVYRRILKKVKSKYLAQALLSISSALVLLILLAAIIVPLISQTQTLYLDTEDFLREQIEEIKTCPSSGDIPFKCSLAKYFASDIEQFQEEGIDLFKKVSLFFVKSLTSVITSIFSFFIFITIVVFSIFYFLDHGKEIKDTLQGVLPLTGSHKTKIFTRLEETIKAVVGGNISTALLQGFAGGLIFLILGISSPLFFGLIMAVLAFIPAIGPALVWIPTVIFLLAKGSFIKAIILTIYGIVVFTWIDNYLKPKFIGDKIKLSSFAIFLAVLGGLQLFGILGLFFGPIILALLVTCVQIYKEM